MTAMRCHADILLVVAALPPTSACPSSSPTACPSSTIAFSGQLPWRVRHRISRSPARRGHSSPSPPAATQGDDPAPLLRAPPRGRAASSCTRVQTDPPPVARVQIMCSLYLCRGRSAYVTLLPSRCPPNPLRPLHRRLFGRLSSPPLPAGSATPGGHARCPRLICSRWTSPNLRRLCGRPLHALLHRTPPHCDQ
ncbi:hypothetical protein FKP32DRAFT_678798 [Trametes sanguinea]|nr:hypothetical protein FKP32DRAFT_678798 [Trametes sanguinea]